MPQVVGRMKADTILGGAAALVAQGFPDTADNLLQQHRDLTDDTAPLAALRARLSVYNAQASGSPVALDAPVCDTISPDMESRTHDPFHPVRLRLENI